MIHIAICDDNRPFLNIIENKINEILEDKKEAVNICKFASGIELIKAYTNKDKPFHIIFLDIDMPKIDGLEVAEVIRDKDEDCILIFLTSMDDKVYKTFKYNTFRFIRKTHMDAELEEALIKSMEKLTTDKHVFKTTIGEVALYTDDILYFEFMDRTVYIKTFDGKYRTNIRRLKDIEDVFLSKGFVSIHRSCIVNENYIKSVGSLEIALDNDERLPVSRYRMEEVKKAFVRAARRG